MIHLKKYEGWKDIFKSKEYSPHEQFMITTLENMFGVTFLMNAAGDGDLKRFRFYFSSEYKPNQQDKEGTTTLMCVATGRGDINDKKMMIKMLIDNGDDPLLTDNNGKTFYRSIKEPELKKWVDNTYPQFEFEMREIANKYNL